MKNFATYASRSRPKLHSILDLFLLRLCFQKFHLEVLVVEYKGFRFFLFGWSQNGAPKAPRKRLSPPAVRTCYAYCNCSYPKPPWAESMCVVFQGLSRHPEGVAQARSPAAAIVAPSHRLGSLPTGTFQRLVFLKFNLPHLHEVVDFDKYIVHWRASRY